MSADLLVVMRGWGGFSNVRFRVSSPSVVVIYKAILRENHPIIKIDGLFFVMGILPTGNFLIYHLRMETRLGFYLTGRVSSRRFSKYPEHALSETARKKIRAGLPSLAFLCWGLESSWWRKKWPMILSMHI
jgi:hypothetical protein